MEVVSWVRVCFNGFKSVALQKAAVRGHSGQAFCHCAHEFNGDKGADSAGSESPAVSLSLGNFWPGLLPTEAGRSGHVGVPSALQTPAMHSGSFLTKSHTTAQAPPSSKAHLHWSFCTSESPLAWPQVPVSQPKAGLTSNSYNLG